MPTPGTRDGLSSLPGSSFGTPALPRRGDVDRSNSAIDYQRGGKHAEVEVPGPSRVAGIREYAPDPIAQPGAGDHDHDRHRQQSRHDHHAEAHARVRAAEPQQDRKSVE